MSITLERMLSGYVECMEWADCGPDHETHGKEWSTTVAERAVFDCAAFIAACGEPLLDALAEHAPGYSDERFGHDFWLTRNGHGAGFWDREELEVSYGASGTIGLALDELAEKAGPCDLYLGDDDLVYLS